MAGKICRPRKSEGTWNLDAFLNALKTELEARERCTAMKTSGPNINTSKFEQYKTRGKQPYSASTLYTAKKVFLAVPFVRRIIGPLTA